MLDFGLLTEILLQIRDETLDVASDFKMFTQTDAVIEREIRFLEEGPALAEEGAVGFNENSLGPEPRTSWRSVRNRA